MKYCWIFFVLFCITNSSQGQRRRAPDRYLDTLAVRVSPLGLIDPFDGNITAGITYSLHTRWTISMDLSCILYSAYITPNTNAIGYIVKPSIRYYFSDKRKFFVEASPFYKRVSYKMNDWLDKDVVNGVPTYQEYTAFHFRKQVAGINFQVGLQKGLIRNNRLRMEVYIGMGIRYKWQDIKNNPGASLAHHEFFFDNSFYQQNILTSSLPHGLRIVYVLK